ncbi:hypothetical protein Goarm_016040 [Gossypium armourianum]|uniref:Uncharacterized protein n=1 Tax=Gossypium armourianum TaxID=34283 RepID=A0A7J9JBU1_9ROSI|nr:hypothetical protein [Gossypium armourianum]
MVVGVGLGVKRIIKEKDCEGAAAGFDNIKKDDVFLDRVEKNCLYVVRLHREGCSFTSRLA